MNKCGRGAWGVGLLLWTVINVIALIVHLSENEEVGDGWIIEMSFNAFFLMVFTGTCERGKGTNALSETTSLIAGGSRASPQFPEAVPGSDTSAPELV